MHLAVIFLRVSLPAAVGPVRTRSEKRLWIIKPSSCTIPHMVALPAFRYAARLFSSRTGGHTARHASNTCRTCSRGR
ncbi:hypothetical protein EV126DRAFT_408832 [Verticillium dahliae]|nr:hypothetical protein EV126DRAFT_408832 [Verticillium dahliae]